MATVTVGVTLSKAARAGGGYGVTVARGAPGSPDVSVSVNTATVTNQGQLRQAFEAILGNLLSDVVK